MPDITMCLGEGCERREKCYRFTAAPNPWRQSYFLGALPQPCEHFVPNSDAAVQDVAKRDDRINK